MAAPIIPFTVMFFHIALPYICGLYIVIYIVSSTPATIIHVQILMNVNSASTTAILMPHAPMWMVALNVSATLDLKGMESPV